MNGMALLAIIAAVYIAVGVALGAILVVSLSVTGRRGKWRRDWPTCDNWSQHDDQDDNWPQHDDQQSPPARP
ncbi:MAG: hypothetical protein J2P25_03815 [Nocardiopsaceae bacterium]|nr:hypothetical protein [Nocardiopsaceae bacterium]